MEKKYKTMICSILIFGLLLCVITGCNKKTLINDDFVQTNVKNISISISNVSPSGATIKIKDNNKHPYIYGEGYVIQKYENGKWQDVKTIIKNYAFNDMGYIVDKNNVVTFNINWEWLYGKLLYGKYRIIKYVNKEEISIEFSIEETTTDITIAYEKTILDNMDSIMNVSVSSSSNPYEYIDNDHYRSIVALGSGAVSVLEDMYNSGKLTGLKAYISALAIEDITGCHLSTKYNWSSAEEFYNLWKTDNCEFEY